MSNEKDPEIRQTENIIEKAVKVSPSAIIFLFNKVVLVLRAINRFRNQGKAKDKDKEKDKESNENKENKENKEERTTAKKRRLSDPNLGELEPAKKRPLLSKPEPNLKATPDKIKIDIPRDHLTRELGPATQATQGRASAAEKVQITKSNKGFKLKGKREVVATNVNNQQRNQRQLDTIKMDASLRSTNENKKIKDNISKQRGPVNQLGQIRRNPTPVTK